VVLVSLSCTDDAIVGPDWDSVRVAGFLPLHLFDNLRVCLLDDLAYSGERAFAPIALFLSLLARQLVIPE